MTDLTPDVTAARSRLRTFLGDEPFPWQLTLLDRMLAEDLPSAVDVPTGLGKTAVIASWLAARSVQRRLPRRLVYVVDRRAVVDQATEVAMKLRELLDADEAVRRDLGLEGPLPISTLRGQFVDNKEWLERPDSPAIVLGTIDMVGSRLLFRGYGVSRKMRPYHAGLLGADTLVVLDEAHLVQPFERLMEQIASGVDAHRRSLRPRDTVAQEVVPAFRFLSLSATGRDRPTEDVLRLTDADRQHSTVRRRLTARKRVVLRHEVTSKDLPEALASEAWTLARQSDGSTRCMVFCTSRDHAQKVQQSLIARASKGGLTLETELFVGGRRVYERESVSRWLGERGFIAGSRDRPRCLTFVVATAAGEVGVDLDADHAVCDAVAWERMVQRFGRVNRRGEADATIIVVPADTDDPKEASRRQAILTLLEASPRREDGEIDASPAALLAIKSDETLRTLAGQATTPAPLHPPLTRALLEAWSMTSLDEHTGRPEVAPWIRGWPDEAEEPQTTVVWRRYLPTTHDRQLLSARDLEIFREAADPHLAERLETESWRVLEWLQARVRTLESPRTKELELDRFDRPLRNSDVIGVLLDSPDGADRVVSALGLQDKEQWQALEKALRGATLVVDRRLGGLSRGLLSADSDHAVDDITELGDRDGMPAPDRIVPFRVRRVFDGSGGHVQEGWRVEASVAVRTSDAGVVEWLFIESVAAAAAQTQDGRSATVRVQHLDEHQLWVESEVCRAAESLNVPSDYIAVLTATARLHDEGKRAPRWQRAFRAPNNGDPPCAKTNCRPDLALLEGYRHELGSLPSAEGHERVTALPPALRELCLHLIAAHHGGARPLIRTSGAAEPPSRLVRRAQEIALRFFAMQQVWGPWGLAWWEAVLRAADQSASRRLERAGESHG